MHKLVTHSHTPEPLKAEFLMNVAAVAPREVERFVLDVLAGDLPNLPLSHHNVRTVQLSDLIISCAREQLKVIIGVTQELGAGTISPLLNGEITFLIRWMRLRV